MNRIGILINLFLFPGTSVGLVLGGGGARGAAHIGMLKAIQEAGIPVDKLGGVSIGAFVGGLWGSSRDMVLMTQKARSYFDLLGNRWLGPIMDFTYPHVSLFTGSYFNWTLRETFGEDLMIEDLWLPFFCCTTDISVSQERVHTKGKALNSFWIVAGISSGFLILIMPLFLFFLQVFSGNTAAHPCPTLGSCLPSVTRWTVICSWTDAT